METKHKKDLNHNKPKQENKIIDKVKESGQIKHEKDVEFSLEESVKKVNPEFETRAKPEIDPKRNMNHLRNKQLY